MEVNEVKKAARIFSPTLGEIAVSTCGLVGAEAVGGASGFTLALLGYTAGFMAVGQWPKAWRKWDAYKSLANSPKKPSSF